MKQVSAIIVSNTDVTKQGATYKFHLVCVEAPEIAAVARPGQFVMVKCEHKLILRRPLSIHQVTNSNQLYLLFNVAGKGTSWLSKCQKGDSLDMLGPLGNGFSIEPASKNLLLVAGGIGIAPLAFLARQALAQGKSLTLLWGASTRAHNRFKCQLPREIKPKITTEDGTAGEKGMITDNLAGPFGWADQVYACGPLAMYQAMAAQKQQQHVRKPVQISLEVRMGCGLGACYGCSIKTRHGMKQVCRDGPVFDLEEILWQEVKI